VLLNKRGFTLIEMMLAMVIILIAMLGLYKSVVVSIDSNVKNVIRDEGTRLAEEVINLIRVIPYNNIVPAGNAVPVTWTDADWDTALPALAAQGYTPPITRDLRNMSVEYEIIVRVTENANTFKQVNVVVGWDHRGEISTVGHVTGKEYEQSVTTLVRVP
jgi:prepilin-type N-terminal cleavage/methylation domain-containing protein